MQRGHGIHIEKPLARAKETVAIVRGLLTQKKFSYDGQWFKPNDFHLREGPIGQAAPPIWLAGLGPKMVGTAAQVADGVIANWLTEESLAEYRGLIAQGAAEGNRDPDGVQVATLLMTCVDPDDEAALFAARRGLAFYCASEHYLHIADICGLGADARLRWAGCSAREGGARVSGRGARGRARFRPAPRRVSTMRLQPGPLRAPAPPRDR